VVPRSMFVFGVLAWNGSAFGLTARFADTTIQHMAPQTRRALLLTIAIAAGACRNVPRSATVTLTVAGMV